MLERLKSRIEQRHLSKICRLMSCASKPPAPPDYVGAAQQQGVANLEAARASARLSNPNMITPYGTQTVEYGVNGDQDIPTVTQSLSPEEQQIFDLNQQARIGLGEVSNQGLGSVRDVLSSDFDPSNLPDQQINAGQTAQDAIMSRLQPQIEMDREMQASTLANQGIPIGSEAYDNAMRVSGQQENDLRTQAALQGMGIGQQARQQALSEQLTLRELPLNEVTALMSGSQVQLPGSSPYQGANVSAGNLMGAAQAQGAGANQQYGMQVAGQNANMGGLYGLGAAAMR
jgi:hypothetical protein